LNALHDDAIFGKLLEELTFMTGGKLCAEEQDEYIASLLFIFDMGPLDTVGF
jgi:hypothetical protein